jgi:hypothetical protein
MVLDDIRSKIDPKQFGSLKGSSASFCLIDMVNNWLRTLASRIILEYAF